MREHYIEMPVNWIVFLGVG